MIITKNIFEHIVYVGATLHEALHKLNDNKHGLVYVVDEFNKLVGSVTDGDVRRWMLSKSDIDMHSQISDIMTSPCFFLSIDCDLKVIENSLSERILSVPLIDVNGRLVAIAESKVAVYFINDRKISHEAPVFVIAEIGNNHQGDLSLAKRLVDIACDAGVDCVKFQMRNISKLYKNSGNANDASADLGAQYTLDLLSKFQLLDDELFAVFDYAKERGVIPLCTPWDLSSLSKLEQYGLPAYKISSADFTNYELLDAVAKTGKLMICSTGMSTESEVVSTIAYLKKRAAQFVLLHTNSTYPTPYKDINLNYIAHLKKLCDTYVGYSGHERGISVPVAAVALGAVVIEKHITTNRSFEGNDHKVSLLPNELNEMVRHIRQVEESMGIDKPRGITQGELMNREVLAKSLVINCFIEKGSRIEKSMIDVRSPGQGLQPNRMSEIVGKNATRRLNDGDYLYESDIYGGDEKKERYKFSRPYGVPVRYHDYKILVSEINLDFVEFHLSYKDLDIDFREYIHEKQNIGFAVHVPELFEGDHLLDLCSLNEEYRNRSIFELNRVISIAKELNEYFPRTNCPILVVNAGGWNVNGFDSNEIKDKKYQMLHDSLRKIESNGIELAFQTMPPFPWHFGGQSHHNLFVDHKEIVAFCAEFNAKICLDISHSMMACNYYGWKLNEFIGAVSPYVLHLHIADADGSDGEGVNMGVGDVDFDQLFLLLDDLVPNVQFIPEVWQGHKDNGQGFWRALSFLEKSQKHSS